MEGLPFIDGPALTATVSWRQAIDALKAALSAGLDLATAAPRTSLATAGGELLLMPAQSSASAQAQAMAGVKVVGVAPANPGRGLPRIQAVYLLFAGDTLTPLALLDGTALTTLRTPAVSALAIHRLARDDAANLVVFGSGPQAAAHVRAVQAIRPIQRVTIIGRSPAGVEKLCAGLVQDGLDVVPGGLSELPAADVVVCASTARTPLFPAGLLAGHACVVAVGSHEPEARELGADVFRRAGRVVVEDRTPRCGRPAM